MNYYKGTVTNIDFDPEFGDITGDEATITVTLPYGYRYANDPAKSVVLSVPKVLAQITEIGMYYMVSEERL